MPSNTADLVRKSLIRKARWGIAEIAFWLVAAATLFFLPGRHLILNEIAIIALFALSLDLILGYAGIVSLGHAAFFGFGAYVAGILAKYGFADPLLGLGGAAIAAALLGFATSFLVLRGTDLTKLMVTLGVALVLGEIANQASWLTGGADGLQGVTMGPVLGLFEFDIFGTTAYAYSLTVTFVLFILARRIVVSPFGLSLRSIRDNPLRARAVGIPVNRRLVAIYTLAAAYAGVAGALLAQTTQFVSLDVLAFHRSADIMLILVIGGAGYLYGGLIGAVGFKVLQDILSAWTPQYWQFWIGLILVVLVLVGRERLTDRVKALWPRSRGRAADHAQTLPATKAQEV
ncbi:branched-chain amino acid ABC transporter permease [Microvirga sp. KLBC 81]|uniref:branched-chain amino acid ABC transporter permease n=1 Tax=Microvirga sp. KLBC 81 TaxID=1862707 RepID=UPI000D524746|nr:branched-chain amino acid ABC transporter permease [Microvirga sp. KLBC 81]PVE25768.1 branched-chain amino acid ABC transporter permease [Microvirga sp. KLBC 81]